MGEALFYHLTESPLEVTLPALLGKALQAGWRVVVRGTDPARIAWLDEKLWLGREDTFLPHGVAGDEFDAEQPILLTTGREAPNRAQCLMAIEGAEVDIAEVGELARVCILFDGNDPEAVARARDQWRVLTGGGVVAQYWSQESGRWQKKAESGAQR